MNKLSKEDLYNVFMKDKLESNIKIYHNTQIKGIIKDYEKLLIESYKNTQMQLLDHITKYNKKLNLKMYLLKLPFF